MNADLIKFFIICCSVTGLFTLLKYLYKFLYFIFSGIFKKLPDEKNVSTLNQNHRKIKPWHVYENHSVKQDKTKDYIQACWDEIR